MSLYGPILGGLLPFNVHSLNQDLAGSWTPYVVEAEEHRNANRCSKAGCSKVSICQTTNKQHL